MIYPKNTDNPFDGENLQWQELSENGQQNKYQFSTIYGVNQMAHRLRAAGGLAQQDRMIRDKRKSLDRAVLYSYQGAFVQRYYSDNTEVIDDGTLHPWRALINPNKLKADYDEKIISVGFESGFKTGDVFEWINTNSYWLIYLQDLTELAYFRGQIRRCSYEIAWEDENKLQKTYVALRGPVETKINYIQKHGISIDTPNYSLNLLMPLNKNTLKQFQRYSKFYLQGHDTCWRVEAIDEYSTPGILEVTAVEYYANETEDDIVNGTVGTLIVKEVDPNGSAESSNAIIGASFIKPHSEMLYEYHGSIKDVEWHVANNKVPVTLNPYYNDKNESCVKVIWNASFSGQFDLYYGEIKKTIVVESLF